MSPIFAKAAVLSAMTAGLLAVGCSAPGLAQDSAQEKAQAKVSVPAECQGMDISPYSAPETLAISSGGHETSKFTVEIADDYPTRAQGLMCRPQLAKDQGMLFEFQDTAERAFWMNNTLIGLDIIYIAPDGRIVSIQKNARPLDRTPLPSHGAASGVLEVQAGLSDSLGLKPGDTVIHPFFRKP